MALLRCNIICSRGASFCAQVDFKTILQDEQFLYESDTAEDFTSAIMAPPLDLKALAQDGLVPKVDHVESAASVIGTQTGSGQAAVAGANSLAGAGNVEEQPTKRVKTENVGS
jgi:hypothetical protein